MNNPYKLIKISNINLHIGNGAKNELKKEQKLYNFKFFYKIRTQYKNCSAGFDNINDFIQFIKPINSQYYIYEYIFEKSKCVPYFDYEFESDIKPLPIELDKILSNILTLIILEFNEIFKIKINESAIKITSSHGFKTNSNGKFKVSWHIIITGHYFESNKQCAYLSDKLKESDKNFDLSVYSQDRMMRTVGSAKNWEDQRVLIPVIINNVSNSNIQFTLSQLEEYLITNIKPQWIKLICPIILKKSVNKKNYIKMHTDKQTDKQNDSDKQTDKQTDKQVDTNIIGYQIEKIMKENFHEDTYFTKSVEKFDGITFYGFNYTNRKQKCFTGFSHDSIGFYCWVDSQSNIMLKCFSENCKGCKKLIGNLSKSNELAKSVQIESKYLNENKEVNGILKSFDKTLLIKSNMGTGKTELICDYITLFKPKRILWISTRQTYATNICSRLKDFNFVNYLDDKENFYTKPRIIVQLESLHMLEKNFKIRMYDLIVLDEIESILYHFDSSTIAQYSANTFDLLYLLCVNKITKIIGMDADLDLRSIEYIKDIDPNYKLVVNKYVNPDIKITITLNKNYFIDKIKKDLVDKKNICIISLSTKLLYQIEEILTELKIKFITHTRDSDDKFKKELEQVNTFWNKYQVVMYSPAISVGIDHTNLYFDSVYSIINPGTASPRVYKQMLGRIRNMKSDTILTLAQSLSTSLDSKLYNYNEMIGYFKYCDHEIKTSKKYRIDSDSNIEVINGFSLYDRIMMHNRIENLNKSTNNFMTQFNGLIIGSNYKIEFISQPINKKNKIMLNDDVYRDKITNAKSINSDEFELIKWKIKSNLATEEEKFSHAQYKFKMFWSLESVDKTNMELYFRCEYTFTRLITLLDKDIIGGDEYLDYQIDKKIKVITNIINTLGFDLKNFDIKIPNEKYYSNVKILLGIDNEFKKDYGNIRILFDKDKHELKEDLKGPSLVKLLNGFLEEFGLIININRTWESKQNIKKRITLYKLNVQKIYIKKI